jgi:hypothetical protein
MTQPVRRPLPDTPDTSDRTMRRAGLSARIHCLAPGAARIRLRIGGGSTGPRKGDVVVAAPAECPQPWPSSADVVLGGDSRDHEAATATATSALRSFAGATVAIAMHPTGCVMISCGQQRQDAHRWTHTHLVIDRNAASSTWRSRLADLAENTHKVVGTRITDLGIELSSFSEVAAALLVVATLPLDLAEGGEHLRDVVRRIE